MRGVAAAAGLLLAAALGCVPYRPFTLPNAEYRSLDAKSQARYRRSIRPCSDGLDLAPGVAEKVAGRCTFAVIEFDDQGELWRERELDDAIRLIDETSRPGQEAIVIAFVHGWKNNASPKNERSGNLGSFKTILAQLAQQELEHRCGGDAACARPVVGVYLSWRGLSAKTPILKQASFFGRKAAAERVARVSFSHAIQRIVAHTKGAKSGGERGNPNSVCVVVGHSFGGLILENTLLRSLTVETNNFGEEFAADLAVLINPANEAILARQFVHALRGAPPKFQTMGEEGRRLDVSLPVIVSVTSKGDWATGKLFPLGLSLESVGKRFHRYDDPADRGEGKKKQAFYYTHTPGHSTVRGGLFSHEVTCPFAAQGCRRATMTEDAWKRVELFRPPAVETGECERESETRRHLHCVERLWFEGPSGQIYELHRLDDSPNQTSYWILQIPTGIVPNHSRIFQSEFLSLLAAFINLPGGHLVTTRDEARRYLEGPPAPSMP